MNTLPVPGLVGAFDVEADLGPLEDHGTTRAGHRRVVPVNGGRVQGELEGEILPGGADWQVVRADGAIDVDARYSVRTPQGYYAFIRARGIRTGPVGVLEALLRGDDVDPAAYYFRTALTIETGAAELAHLEHALFIAVAAREARRVRYRAYRVS